MSSPAGGGEFDEFYYKHCVGGDAYSRDRSWLAFNATIAEQIIAEIRPQRVLDAGCGFGFLVEALRERGVEAYGIDLSAYAIENVHASVKPFCRQGSITDELDEDYDLIVTIECVEHIPSPGAEQAIANMCAHANDVLFSSTPFDYRELTHVHVQPMDYWAGRFARHGFYRDVDFDASFITPWATRFRRSDEPAHRIVRDYERKLAALVIERNDLRKRAVELQTELAHRAAPPHQKAVRLARRIAGRLLRPFR